MTQAEKSRERKAKYELQLRIRKIGHSIKQRNKAKYEEINEEISKLPLKQQLEILIDEDLKLLIAEKELEQRSKAENISQTHIEGQPKISKTKLEKLPQNRGFVWHTNRGKYNEIIKLPLSQQVERFAIERQKYEESYARTVRYVKGGLPQ